MGSTRCHPQERLLGGGAPAPHDKQGPRFASTRGLGNRRVLGASRPESGLCHSSQRLCPRDSSSPTPQACCLIPQTEPHSDRKQSGSVGRVSPKKVPQT